jgi:hypothetical protein
MEGFKGLADALEEEGPCCQGWPMGNTSSIIGSELVPRKN